MSAFQLVPPKPENCPQKRRIDALSANHTLPDEDLSALLTDLTPEDEGYLYAKAREIRETVYGKDVYLRGLIEYTSYCKNDCLYCGIRRSNRCAQRYRLTAEQILSCCRQGYGLGFRTFVLQGGEDPYDTDERMCALVSEIRRQFPDCAITLSLGERSRESYQKLYDAGADRYLLRHETADSDHYAMLHPPELSAAHRQQCLRDLKEIGYQVGAGMMVGAPYQTTAHLIADLRFLQELQPHMIGIGPFIPHKDTPLKDCPPGTLEDTLHLLGILRLMFPMALLPATTALGTIHPLGREKGVLAGANVVMPNLSPTDVRDKYLLYDGKICTGDEAAECHRCMEMRMESVGYHVAVSRGDAPGTAIR